MENLRFIDLFAGLGGFHQALASLGHRCVFASEIDDALVDLYHANFGLKPHGDIRQVVVSEIPAHDVLCAGFPCQPFSKAGEQKGLQCPQWGDLIDYVVRILRTHKPSFLIIENVPNLVRHENGRTWNRIKHQLRLAGYSIDARLLSPHHFNVPQIRERAFIVGRRGGLASFRWPEPSSNPDLSISSVLDRKPRDAKPLSATHVAYLDAWQDFVHRYPRNEELPSFPIWAMEFGATYPFEVSSPLSTDIRKLRGSKGSFGKALRSLAKSRIEEALPPYARTLNKKFPQWKIDFIKQNRDLYDVNRRWIRQWLPSIVDFAPSFQKLEWNCKGERRDIWKYVIQFRASGIRVKRPTSAPALVAMTTSQVPIIGWERRFMTIRECSRLQSMGDLRFLPNATGSAFKALGNAVNVEVVRAICKQLLPLGVQRTKRRKAYLEAA